MVGNKKVLSMVLATTITVGSLMTGGVVLADTPSEYYLGVISEEIEQGGIKISPWAEQLYGSLKDRGFLKGKLGIEKDFTASITREEFAELVANYLDKFGLVEEQDIVFIDTQNESILKVARLGIVSGVGEGRFAPNKEITREQLAQMLSKVDELITKDKRIYGGNLDHFTDNAEISEWARAGVSRVSDVGLMQGSDNNFNPQGLASREQALQILQNLISIRGENTNIIDNGFIIDEPVEFIEDTELIEGLEEAEESDETEVQNTQEVKQGSPRYKVLPHKDSLTELVNVSDELGIQ